MTVLSSFLEEEKKAKKDREIFYGIELFGGLILLALFEYTLGLSFGILIYILQASIKVLLLLLLPILHSNIEMAPRGMQSLKHIAENIFENQPGFLIALGPLIGPDKATDQSAAREQ